MTLGLLLSTITVTLAQKDKAGEIRSEFWGNKHKKYTNNEVPEKWNGESAVILYQNFSYEYDKSSGKIYNIARYHRKIKLQDKAAVKEYSEFSFTETFKGQVGYRRSKGKTFVGFKIIKPDGSEKEVDLANAAEIKNEDGDGTVKKLAIPGLQEGDIIDYYYFVIERFKADLTHTFQPVLTTLSSTYPICYQEVSFSVEKNFYINFRPTNGAPDLRLKETGKRKVYTVKEENIDRYEDLLWLYKYRSLPTIKFQVIYNKRNTPVPAFVGKNGKAKKDVSYGEVRQLLMPSLNSMDLSARSTYKLFKKYLKENNLNGKNKREMVELAYYYLYHYSIGMEIEEYYVSDDAREPGYNQYGFVSTLHYILDMYDIDNELIVTIPRDIAHLDDLLLFQEIAVMLRVQLGEEDIYLSNFGLHPRFGEVPPDYEGNKAYVFSFSSSGGGQRIATLPTSNKDDNHSQVQVNASFLEGDMNTLLVETSNEMKGHNRRWAQNRFINIYDFLDEEYEQYGTKSFVERGKRKKSEKVALNQKIKEFKERLAENREERLKANAEDDYKAEIIDLKNFKINNLGRDHKSPNFNFDAGFEVKGLVKKAGPNHIIEVGKLISSQIEVPEEGMKRSQDVYMPYARSYNYTIQLTIPEGYKVQGLEKLNMKVENTTGGFTSAARMDGNQLIIDTYKYYSNNFEPAANWPKLIEFLEAAYKFTQTKVLLKKA